MDNAAKAIVITGAVLIAIGLVGLGVYLFQTSSRLTKDASDSMSAREIATVNATFKRYAGDCLGVDVVSLIRTVQTHNKNHESYQINVSVNGTTYTTDNALKRINNASKYEVSFGYNDSGMVNEVKIN